jgi:SAM-dependent methyltransferase
MMQKGSKLLLDHLDLLQDLDKTLPVLDLACGMGRNGLLLAEHGLNVVFADRSATALSGIDQQLQTTGLTGRTWQVDLEQPGVNPFGDDVFSAIIAFRYLHRPLFPPLRDAVTPGGLVIYETFTTANREFGRPRSEDFLLLPGELKSLFEDWDIIYDFEGLKHNPDRHVAQIVARKP